MSDTQTPGSPPITSTTTATGNEGTTTTATEGQGSQTTSVDSGQWFSQIKDPQLRGWVELKGHKDMEGAIKSYYDTEKFKGVPVEKVLTLPKDETDAEGYQKIYKALGKPDAPDGYKIDIPEGVDSSYAKEAAKWFHEAGLNQSQVEKLVKFNNDFAAAMNKQAQDAAILKQTEIDAQSAAELKKLTAEMGGQAKYEESMELGRRFAKANGWDADLLSKIEGVVGTYGFAKFITGIAASSGMSEDKLHGVGTSGAVGYTKDGAAAKREELMKDNAFVDRYVKGDIQARKEMDRLERIMAGVE